MLTAFITALAGVWLICAAFAGYALRSLSTPMRFGFGVAGLLLFIPAETHAIWRMDRHHRALLGGALFAYEFMAVRRIRRQPA